MTYTDHITIADKARKRQVPPPQIIYSQKYWM